MNIAFSNLKNLKNTTPGVAETVFLAPVSFFSEGGIKSPGEWLEAGDSVKIKDTHEFLDGMGFLEAVLPPEKNQLDAKSVGDLLFQKLDKELKIFLPGSYADLHEWVYRLLNQPVIALIRDSSCSENIWYQLGDPCVFAYMSAEFTTETTKGNVKGYTIVLRHSSPAIYFYEGAIIRIGGVVPGAAGLLTEDLNFLITDEEGNPLT